MKNKEQILEELKYLSKLFEKAQKLSDKVLIVERIIALEWVIEE